MGFSNTIDRAFAEIVLHLLLDENRRNLASRKEVSCYYKITVAMGLPQNNTYVHELVLFCLIISCVHCICFIFTKIVSTLSGFASINIGRCN